MKKHSIDKLTAYYTKKGRLWWVEQGEKQETFTSIEAMVEKYPKLLEVELIAASVERRALARGPKDPVSLNEANTEIISKTVQCFYCDGTGIVVYMPCTHCDGSGKITIDTRGIG